MQITTLPKDDVKRGEIYYISRGGYNTGSEQQADRPGVIVSNDKNNKNSQTLEFVKPELKKYSAKKLLTQDRLMNAMIGIREIQTKLWETMPDDQYEKLEPEFDTAIAAMMAHMCGVMPAHAQLDQENSQDILMPAT